MFDDLRAKSASPFEDDEAPEDQAEGPRPRKSKKSVGGGGEIPLFGLTAAQRLVLMIMVFLNISVLGCFALLALEKIVPF